MHRLRRAAARAVPLLALSALGAAPIRGQATPHLPPSDPAYNDLGRLAAWGLIDTLAVARRPWSRRQAAGMVAQALRSRDRLADDPALAATASTLLDRLSRRLGPELARLGVVDAAAEGWLPLVDEVRLDARWTDSPPRAVPSNEVALIDAVVNPLVAYDEGRPVEEGVATGVEVAFRGRLGDPLAFSVRPRVAVVAATPGGTGEATEVTLQNAHARLLLGGVALTAGRDHVLWGPAPRGGLMLSANPAALTMASLENEGPFTLPWLGPTWLQLFYADLGTEAQRFPHTYVVGFRGSFLPHPRVEAGLGFLTQSGGEGSPEASLGDRLLDHLFFPDLFLDREFAFSQKMAGFDVRVRVPEARGMEVYVEGVIDDIDVDRFRSMVWEDGGWVAGVRLARLDDAGRWGLRVEGEHTGIRFYRHQDFSSGVTLERRILGSELGPDANALRVGVTWDRDPVNAFALDAAWERRSNDHYLLVVGNPYYFARTRILPKEVRRRVVGTWEHRRWEPGSWLVRAQGGYEHVGHFAFSRTGSQHNLLARLVVEVRTR